MLTLSLAHFIALIQDLSSGLTFYLVWMGWGSHLRVSALNSARFLGLGLHEAF